MAQTVPDTTPVNIPDANLQARLEFLLGKNAGETITRADMARDWTADTVRLGLHHAYWGSIAVPTPPAPATVIRDLTGLEYLTRTYGINLIRNRITDLRPLAGLTNTRRLWLSENLISDLSPLAGLTLDHLSI